MDQRYTHKMTSRGREKVAIIVFSVLILIGMGCLVGYLSVGHSWNVAASSIDDATGEMESYTAIIYDGTAVPKVTPQQPTTPAPGTATTESTSSQTPSGTTDPSASSTAGVIGTPASSEGQAIGGQQPDDPDELTAEQAAASSAQETDDSVPVTVDAVATSYREKLASVFVVDVVNPETYDEFTILKRGKYRFGVMWVPELQKKVEYQQRINHYRAANVDFVVVVTAKIDYVKDLSGVDIVISLQDEGLFMMGETRSGTFYVDAPLVGQVGTVLVSPNKVVSAKDIDAL